MSYRRRNRSGPPAWFVFLLGTAFVFGLYYLYMGARDFFQNTSTSISISTQEASVAATSTSVRIEEIQSRLLSAGPTSTPQPECQEFVVSVVSAVVRAEASTNSAFVENLSQGVTVCVISREANSEWYLIDRNPVTRRIEPAYMREDVINPVNPTPTPTRTVTPPPTITATYTPTLTITPSPEPTRPSSTPDPNATPTATMTPTITETPPAVNL